MRNAKIRADDEQAASLAAHHRLVRIELNILSRNIAVFHVVHGLHRPCTHVPAD
jgi:hypothetical protein